MQDIPSLGFDDDTLREIKEGVPRGTVDIKFIQFSTTFVLYNGQPFFRVDWKTEQTYHIVPGGFEKVGKPTGDVTYASQNLYRPWSFLMEPNSEFFRSVFTRDVPEKLRGNVQGFSLPKGVVKPNGPGAFGGIVK
jgi:hypothetical protein